jgi:hypothetical protein
MTVEGGLMTGIVEPCRPVREFLKERRGLDGDRDRRDVRRARPRRRVRPHHRSSTSPTSR